MFYKSKMRKMYTTVKLIKRKHLMQYRRYENIEYFQYKINLEL